MTSSSFRNMKRNSSTSAEELQKKLDAMSSKGYTKESDDERFWRCHIDEKTKVGQATIRFLPATDGEDTPFVRVWSHGWQSKLTGKWYIQNSRTTLGQDEKDPCGEMNKEIWDTGDEALRKSLISDPKNGRKRKLSYYSNIMVIKDPANPANNGKVFLFKYGQKIFDKIQGALKPKYDDMPKIDVFNPWEGATFNLRISLTKDGPNYDDSTFDIKPSALFDGDDEKIEAVWKQQHSLNQFIAPERFKSYEELYRMLREVLGAEANNYKLFGGNAKNAGKPVSHDRPASAPAPEAGRQKRAEDLPVDTGAEPGPSDNGGDDTPPWTDEPAGQDSTATDYFGNMFKD